MPYIRCRSGWSRPTKRSVRFMRIMIPERIIKGRRVGTIFVNQSVKPVEAYSRDSAG